MPFKKLHVILKEILEQHEISTPTDLQKVCIPAIKSGQNIFCIAPTNYGKTTSLVITTLHTLQCEEMGTAPRAIILVENNSSAAQMYDTFVKFTRSTSLRVYFCDEKQHIDLLKSEIFEGVDILIATPKIMYKLILLEGVNTTQLKMISIDDGDFLTKTTTSKDILGITQSIYKCQFVLYASKMHLTLKRFESYFMQHAKTILIE